MRFTLLLVVCLLSGCGIPDPPGPLLVTPSDLARAFRDAPATASTAYRGIVIVCPVEHCKREGHELTWSLGGSDDSIPVIRFTFADGETVPEPIRGVHIIGRCMGRMADGQKRELGGYEFVVTVSECREAK